MLPCEQVEVMLRAQCLSNPLPWREDRSVRGSVLRHRKNQAKRETRYKICKLALMLTHAAHTHLGMGTHPLPGHTHSVSLLPSVFSSSRLLFPDDQQALRKCELYPICGQWMIFSCFKSFTRVSCHTSPHRCQNGKPQAFSKVVRRMDVRGNTG